VVVEVRQLGGALAAPDSDDAFCHRDAAYNLLTIGIGGQPGVVDHAAAVVKALDPWATGGACRTSAARRRPRPTTRHADPAAGGGPDYDPARVLALGRLLDA
jgi:hypothetical protein